MDFSSKNIPYPGEGLGGIGDFSSKNIPLGDHTLDSTSLDPGYPLPPSRPTHSLIIRIYSFLLMYSATTSYTPHNIRPIINNRISYTPPSYVPPPYTSHTRPFSSPPFIRAFIRPPVGQPFPRNEEKRPGWDLLFFVVGNHPGRGTCRKDLSNGPFIRHLRF